MKPTFEKTLNILKRTAVYAGVIVLIVLVNVGAVFVVRETSIYLNDKKEVNYAKGHDIVRREEDYTVTAKDENGDSYNYNGKRIWTFDGKKFTEM